jgi:hypothetical protein
MDSRCSATQNESSCQLRLLAFDENDNSVEEDPRWREIQERTLGGVQPYGSLPTI